MASEERLGSSEKQPYEAPQICEIGSLRELTMGKAKTGLDSSGAHSK